jgi:hypothetical protein
MRLGTYWKAIIGGLAAGTASLATAAQDGVVSGGEGAAALLALLGGLGLTWLVPNREQAGGRDEQ